MPILKIGDAVDNKILMFRLRVDEIRHTPDGYYVNAELTFAQNILEGFNSYATDDYYSKFNWAPVIIDGYSSRDPEGAIKDAILGARAAAAFMLRSEDPNRYIEMQADISTVAP